VRKPAQPCTVWQRAVKPVYYMDLKQVVITQICIQWGTSCPRMTIL